MGERSWSGAVRHRGPRTTSPRRTRIEGLELSPIKAVELEASRIPDVVSLAQGIPSFDTPEPIKRFVQERLSEDVCARYSVTPGLPRLRESIAESLRRDGMAYDADGEILVTAGSIEAIAASLLALVEPGDEVLVVSPTYASYLPAIRLAGAVPRFVPLAEDANFDLDPDAIEDAVGRRTRALILCNPNNPTGTVFSAEQTRRMLRVAEREDLIVIADEVYKDFLYGEARIHSAATEVWARDRVLRVCSFSKAYAMTGWRVGFVHGPAPLISEVLKVHDTLVTCAPVVSQYAALAALELGDAEIASFRAEFRRRRDQVIERLDALPHVFDYQKPNASYFVFPRVKDTVPLARDSRRLAADILARAHVALVPGVAFGPTGESHLRLCYARPAADIHRAFDRLDDYFAGRPARTTPPAPAAPGTPAIRGLGRRAGVAVLRHGARVHLARTRPRVIAIAGTQGKTVIKRAVAELLGRTLRVRSNPLSYNTAVGLPLAVLGRRLDTRRPARAAGEVAAALCSAYASRARVDAMVLELGVRASGDMQAHLEVVRPDIVVVAPLASSFSDDAGALSTLRREIDTLCRTGTASAVLLCTDDPFLAELAERTPAAVGFSRDDVVAQADGLVLRVDGAIWPVGLDVVGASQLRSLSVAARAGRLLGVGDADIGGFLAG
jgi:aspartate/methionine/tyrosine aminotransferase